MAMTRQAINMSALINMIRKSFIPLMPDCFASSTRSEIEKSDFEIKVYIYATKYPLIVSRTSWCIIECC